MTQFSKEYTYALKLRPPFLRMLDPALRVEYIS